MGVLRSSTGWVSATQIGDVPDSPGIYAWYACFPRGQAAQFGEGKSFRLILDPFDVALRSPAPVTISVVTDNMKAEWKHRVEASPRAYPDRVEKLLEGPSSLARQALWEALSEPQGELGVPVYSLLSAPLYVGKTEHSLAVRLKSHVSAMRDSAVELEEERVFADRCSKVGLNETHLAVWYFAIDIEADGVTTDDRNRTIIALEALLNRWHRPVFGRS